MVRGKFVGKISFNATVICKQIMYSLVIILFRKCQLSKEFIQWEKNASFISRFTRPIGVKSDHFIVSFVF